jgi:hypothetical protein
MAATTEIYWDSMLFLADSTFAFRQHYLTSATSTYNEDMDDHNPIRLQSSSLDVFVFLVAIATHCDYPSAPHFEEDECAAQSALQSEKGAPQFVADLVEGAVQFLVEFEKYVILSGLRFVCQFDLCELASALQSVVHEIVFGPLFLGAVCELYLVPQFCFHHLYVQSLFAFFLGPFFSVLLSGCQFLVSALFSSLVFHLFGLHTQYLRHVVGSNRHGYVV